MELTPFINKNDDIPIYLQLYYFFRDEIESGKLVPGTKLPSIRQLSDHLQISKNTVETAYQQLTAEGYLESKEKSGLFVIEIEEGFPKQTLKEPAELDYSSEGPPENKYIDFQYGDIDLEHFPYKTWKKCVSEAIEYANQEVFSYGDKKGILKLRKEIASYLYQARGVRCTPRQIVLSAGTQSAISLICQILELPLKNIAMEDPGYDGVRLVLESHKCQLNPVPLEEDGINLEKLAETSADCVYVTPSHQFPIGMIMPIQKRLKLLQWAEKNQSYIIEDDYDGEFRYIGHPIPSLKSLDNGNRVIYLGTFSKAFLPAARVTYIVLPEALMNQYESKLYFYNQTVSPLIQDGLYRFMKDGHFARHIRKMRKIYQKKQKVLLNAIETYLGDQVSVIGQKAGLHLLLKFKDIGAAIIIEKAKQSGVLLYLTEKFWQEKHKYQDLVMVGFGGLTEEEIETGIKRIATILAKQENLSKLSN